MKGENMLIHGIIGFAIIVIAASFVAVGVYEFMYVLFAVSVYLVGYTMYLTLPLKEIWKWITDLFS